MKLSCRFRNIVVLLHFRMQYCILVLLFFWRLSWSALDITRIATDHKYFLFAEEKRSAAEVRKVYELMGNGGGRERSYQSQNGHQIHYRSMAFLKKYAFSDKRKYSHLQLLTYLTYSPTFAHLHILVADSWYSCSQTL